MSKKPEPPKFKGANPPGKNPPTQQDEEPAPETILGPLRDRYWRRFTEAVEAGVAKALTTQSEQTQANITAGTSEALTQNQPVSQQTITAGTAEAISQSQDDNADTIAAGVFRGILVAIQYVGKVVADSLRPGPPSNLHFTIQRKSQMPKVADVTVSWDLSVSTDVTSQHFTGHVILPDGTSAADVDIDIPASQNSYLFQKVGEGCTVSVAITATNENGTSDPATGSITLPSDLGPPQPPTNVSFAISNVQDGSATPKK